MITLLAGLVGLVTILMALDPYLPARRPRLFSLGLAGLLFGCLSALILLGLDLNQHTAPLSLLTLAIALAVLGGVTATDVLRDRMVNAYILLAGTVVVLILSIGARLGTSDWAHGILGLLVTAGAGAVLFGGGLLFARLRHAPIDDVTGSQTQDFGFGDVLVYALIGAALGPQLGLAAFVAGIFAGGLLALPIFVFDRLRGNDLMSRHVPMLPGIVSGTMVVLLFTAASH